MSTRRPATRWFDLAQRVRQWSLDERSPELRQAQAREDLARHERKRAEVAALDAAAAKADLLSRSSFDAAALLRHAAFEEEMRRRHLMARAHEDAARSDVALLRDELQHMLAERDALRRRAEQVLEGHRQMEQQVATREADELWLARLSSAGRSGEQHEE